MAIDIDFVFRKAWDSEVTPDFLRLTEGAISRIGLRLGGERSLVKKIPDQVHLTKERIVEKAAKQSALKFVADHSDIDYLDSAWTSPEGVEFKAQAMVVWQQIDGRFLVAISSKTLNEIQAESAK